MTQREGEPESACVCWFAPQVLAVPGLSLESWIPCGAAAWQAVG